jgi:hypothetical protein
VNILQLTWDEFKQQVDANLTHQFFRGYKQTDLKEIRNHLEEIANIILKNKPDNLIQ